MEILIKNVDQFINIEPKDDDVVVLEGFSTNTFEGGGKFVLATTRSQVPGYRYRTKNNKFFQRVLVDNKIHLVDMGWTPDYREDCSTMINQLMNAASISGAEATLPLANILRCNNSIRFPVGLKKINGNNSTIFYYNPKVDGVAGKNFWTTNYASDLVIEYLHIDYDYNSNIIDVIGLFNTNLSNVKLLGCNISSYMNHAILFRTNKDTKNDLVGNTVDYCQVVVYHTDPTQGKLGIIFDDDNPGISGKMDKYYQDNGKVALPISGFYHKNYTITNNRVYGGRYGINGNFLLDSTIKGNKTYNNTRGLAFQNRCTGNTITNNLVLENKSSANLFNYGCSNNVFSNNEAYSSRNDGQAFIQTSVDSVGNKFSNCKFESTSESGPQWLLYCGLDASNNEFSDITINSNCSKSLICIESSWVASDNYNYGGNDTWATRDSNGNTFKNITINSNSNKVGIYLGSGSKNLIGTTIQNVKLNAPNLVKSAMIKEFSKGNVTDTVFEDNLVDYNKLGLGDLDRFDSYRVAKS
jgi:parallel beta-helix repeat protein